MSRLRLPHIAPSEITPEEVWTSRREWLRHVGMGALALGAGGILNADLAAARQVEGMLAPTPNSDYWLNDKLTSEEDIRSYNNFYELLLI